MTTLRIFVPFALSVRLSFCFSHDRLVYLRALLLSQVYRVKDNVTYSVVIEEFDSEKGGWKPYTAEDVQARKT